MSLQIITATVRPEHVPAVETAVRELFAALDRTEPAAVRYASLKADDGTTFLIMLELEDPAANPLVELEEVAVFHRGLGQWLGGPPDVAQFTLVGSYRVF